MYSTEYQQYLDSLPQELLLKILENAYVEIFVTDKKGRYVYANPIMLRHYGMSSEQMKNADMDELRRTKWSVSLTQKVCRTKRTIIAHNKYYCMHQYVTTVAVPIFDDNGNVEYVVQATLDQIPYYDIDQEVVDEGKQDESDEALADGFICGGGKSSLKYIKAMKKMTKTDSTVLMLGESGCGKSLSAKFIHQNSTRKNAPFIAVNCGAIADNLFESELFGYQPYAFTGANNKGKKGIIESVDGGTLFLDEIADLPHMMQVKLLDVLENRRFLPVGGTTYKEVDVRIITATNKNLEKLVKEGKFREDLYWRINTFKITVPSLRQRREDIILFVNYFLDKLNKKYDMQKFFSQKAVTSLYNYDWPGNIRQLKNAIEQMMIYSDDDEIPNSIVEEYFLENKPHTEDDIADNVGYDELIEQTERKLIMKVYEPSKTIKEIANELEVSQSKAYRLLQKYIHADLQ